MVRTAGEICETVMGRDMRKFIFVIAGAAFLAFAVGASAQQRLPQGTQVLPGPILPGPRLPPEVLTPTIPSACQVDPAIRSVTLTKGSRPLQVRISYEIVNAGRSTWTSGANQQGANLVARNGNTGRDFTSYQRLAARAAAGGSMLRFTSPMIDNAFDNFEFGGHVDLTIGYDPDILIDGNNCNDDSNNGNNRLRIENAEILGFMRGTARSQTFRP